MAGVAVSQRSVNGRLIDVETPDSFQLVVDFGESGFASITTGYTMVETKGPAIEVYGDGGVLQMLGDDWAPSGYEMCAGDNEPWQVFREKDPTWHWTDGLRHAVECIRSGQTPLVSPEHAYHVLEIMLRAYEAVDSGKTVNIESRFSDIPLDPESIHTGLLEKWKGRPVAEGS
jgi:predicted dehydrogenase